MLNRRIRQAIEQYVGNVWVEAEISNVTQAQSGHVYLTLKDDNSQIRGIIWRSTLERIKFEPEAGQKVICRGNIEVYSPRGEYQICIDRLEPQGIGALELAFRQLHARLEAEGLFAIENKKLIPIPQHIGLITSPAGAAIADFLKILLRRWPKIRVTLIPTPVQGAEAGRQIALSIRRANRMQETPDVLVVTRGGGSLEDLWAFNEEVVVREIFRSKIPVISAVGHEIDITLTDLVADARAATPSEAAETIVPNRQAFLERIFEFKTRLQQALMNRAFNERQKLELLSKSRALRNPYEIVQTQQLRLDELAKQMNVSMQQKLQLANQNTKNIARQLHAMSPLAVLARGYTVTQTADGRVVSAADDVAVDDEMTTRTASGTITSRVTDKQND